GADAHSLRAPEELGDHAPRRFDARRPPEAAAELVPEVEPAPAPADVKAQAIEGVCAREVARGGVERAAERAGELAALGQAGARRDLALAVGERGRGAIAELVRDLTEDPRARRRRSADHHAVAAGLAQHAQGVVGGLDVAVADHRDGDRVADARDVLP